MNRKALVDIRAGFHQDGQHRLASGVIGDDCLAVNEAGFHEGFGHYRTCMAVAPDRN
jgi:hypothetical protein